MRRALSVSHRKRESARSYRDRRSAARDNVRPDIDLYIYGPDGSEVASSTGTTADEAVELDYRDFQRHSYGTYTAEVRNFSNLLLPIISKIWFIEIDLELENKI